MKVGVLGTGMVGSAIGTRLVELGHQVRMGSRQVPSEKAVQWAESAGDRASSGDFADAASFGEVVFNCTAGEGSVDAVTSARDGLAGKLLIESPMRSISRTGPLRSSSPRIGTASPSGSSAPFPRRMW
jgi:predicted dinucleotide-binding enzyme